MMNNFEKHTILKTIKGDGKFIVIDPESEYKMLSESLNAEAIGKEKTLQLVEEGNKLKNKEERIFKRLFKCNEDGVAEWCIAGDKQQAYEFMKSIWGESTMKEYENEHLEYNQDSTLVDFIENFFIEEPCDKDFTITDAGEHGEPVTKKVSEWVADSESIPCYLCHEN